jgi:alkanesulfonate monooxygenase SsuD/methylene tetrahydromethanopterin reductase-like flavin-dependent oxidoreductase (luciferase family)
MGDYGQRLRFGHFLDPEVLEPGGGTELVTTAQRADLFGLDLLGIPDRPYDGRHVDALALMATVLAVARRIRVFPAVACLPLRPPALLAKAMASLDVLSGGRVELGLGAGYAGCAGSGWDGVQALGGRRLPADGARAALEEAVLVVRALWDGPPRDGAGLGPAPVHRIGVWLGVTGPRSLALAGRVADGWIALSSRLPPARLPDAQRRIDEAALEAGRDPADIRRIYVLNGSIGRCDGSGAAGLLKGDPARWAAEIAELAVGCGVDSFLYGGDPAGLDAFALEIVPQVRETVGRERGKL